MAIAAASGPLAPFRVLDLTDELGHLAGRMLAELGADVIKLEAPNGGGARLAPPFYHDEPHPERSLLWWTLNHSKRSITIELSKPRGAELFFQLVDRSDFIVESTPPGAMESVGLGWDLIHERNPRLVMTSITPFGQDGPYANWRATDLIGVAMGGLASLCGSPGRPPIRPSAAQGYAQACAQAVVGTMIAHFHRTRTGRGQRVDQSMQEAVTFTHDNAMPTWDIRGINIGRPGNGRNIGGYEMGQYVYEAADGARRRALLRRPVRTHRPPDESPGSTTTAWPKTSTPRNGWPSSTPRRACCCHPAAPMVTISTTCSCASASASPALSSFSEAQQIRNGWGIVHTPADLLENEHLAARDYWVEVEHEDIDERVTYPGPWAKLLRDAALRERPRAPPRRTQPRGLRRSAGPLRRRKSNNSLRLA